MTGSWDSPRTTGARTPYGWLAAILLTATALRTLGVASQGLWFDEGLTIVLSRWPAWDMLLLPTDPTPPLYYLLHKMFIPPDASLLGVRSISIVSGVISIGLMYVLGRLSFGQLGGLIAAGLLAVWTTHVDYSQEARSYSLLFMLTLTASIGVVIYGQATTSSRRLLGLALLAVGDALSFYTHLTSVFWIAATSLMVLGLAIRGRRPLGEIAGAFAIMAMLALPGIYRLTIQGLHNETFTWLVQANVSRFIASLAQTMLPAGYWDSRWSGGARALIRYMIEVLGFLVLVFAVWRWGPRLGKNSSTLLIVAYLAMPFVIWSVGFFATPIYMTRTVLFVVPGFILLITGICVHSPAPRLAAFALGAIYLVSTLLSGLMREKDDIRGATRFLEASVKPLDIIAVCRVAAYPGIRFHSRVPTGSLVVGAHRSRQLIELEGPLGSNPSWDQRYFDQVTYPNFMGTGPDKPATELLISPGQVIWRVDSHCRATARAIIDAALWSTNARCVKAWRELRSGSDAVTVQRCVVNTAAHWPILTPFSNSPARSDPARGGPHTLK